MCREVARKLITGQPRVCYSRTNAPVGKGPRVLGGVAGKKIDGSIVVGLLRSLMMTLSLIWWMPLRATSDG